MERENAVFVIFVLIDLFVLIVIFISALVTCTLLCLVGVYLWGDVRPTNNSYVVFHPGASLISVAFASENSKSIGPLLFQSWFSFFSHLWVFMFC